MGMPDRASLDIDDLLREAREAGVGRVVVSSSVFPGSPITNDRLASEIKRDSGVLVGCGSIDPRSPSPYREVMRCVEELGFRAIKVVPFFNNLAPDDRMLFPVYAACQDLRIPVLILTGHMAVRAPSRYGQPLRIDEIALAFPNLTVIAGHAGWPWTDELISVAWKHANVYIDTSGHRPKHWPTSLTKFAATYGAAKVLFGSGYPMLSYESLINDFRSMNLPPSSYRKIMYENAAELLSLEVRP